MSDTPPAVQCLYLIEIKYKSYHSRLRWQNIRIFGRSKQPDECPDQCEDTKIIDLISQK